MSEYRLRDMTLEDLPRILGWRNSSRVRESMFNRHTITPEEHRAWFERRLQDPDTRELVFELEGVPVGVVNFSGLSSGNGTISWGFYVGAEGTPKGTGARMLALALDEVFASSAVETVESEVLADNLASAKVHEKLGFSRIGDGTHESDSEAALSIIKYALPRGSWRQRRGELVRELFEHAEGGTDDGQ